MILIFNQLISFVMSITVNNNNFARYNRLDLADLLLEKIGNLNEILSNFTEETLFTIEIVNLRTRIEETLEGNPFQTTYSFIFIPECEELITEASECEQVFRIHVENNTYVLPTLTFVD